MVQNSRSDVSTVIELQDHAAKKQSRRWPLVTLWTAHVHYAGQSGTSLESWFRSASMKTSSRALHALRVKSLGCLLKLLIQWI